MKYCFSCGKKLVAEGRFCPSCGVKLQDELNLEKVPIAQQQTKKSAGEANRKTIIGAILVAAFLYFVYPEAAAESPSDIAETFIEYTVQSEWNRAEALWSESGKEEMVSYLGDDRWILQVMENLSHRYYTDRGYSVLYDYEVSYEEIDRSEAYIEFDFTFDDGKQEKAMFQMVKEEDEWKVYAFESGQ